MRGYHANDFRAERSRDVTWGAVIHSPQAISLDRIERAMERAEGER